MQARHFISTLALGMFTMAAQAGETKGVYVGGMLGQSHVVENCEGFDLPCEDKATGLRAHMGMRMGYVGLEAGYQYFGEAESIGPGYRFSVNGAALTGQVTGALPLGEHVELIGKAGLAFWAIEGEGVLYGYGYFREDDSGVAPVLSLGGRVRVADKVWLTVAADHYSEVGDDDTIGTSDINVFAAGLDLHF